VETLAGEDEGWGNQDEDKYCEFGVPAMVRQQRTHSGGGGAGGRWGGAGRGGAGRGGAGRGGAGRGEAGRGGAGRGGH
jgi:hypothetical protein